MNDLIVLPVVLILIGVAGETVSGGWAWVEFVARFLVLGPLTGFAIGGAGSWLMGYVDRTMGIRWEYQALYGLGLVQGAYAGAGFLTAFAAGLAVVMLNQSMCECFMEYGETTAEIAMLFAFVLFGAVLSAVLGDAQVVRSIALAAFLIAVLRPAAISTVVTCADGLGSEGVRCVVWATRTQLAPACAVGGSRRVSRRGGALGNGGDRGHRLDLGLRSDGHSGGGALSPQDQPGVASRGPRGGRRRALRPRLPSSRQRSSRLDERRTLRQPSSTYARAQASSATGRTYRATSESSPTTSPSGLRSSRKAP